MHSLKRHEMAGITEIYTAKAMLDSHMVYGVKPGKKERGEKDNSFRNVIFLFNAPVDVNPTYPNREKAGTWIRRLERPSKCHRPQGNDFMPTLIKSHVINHKKRDSREDTETGEANIIQDPAYRDTIEYLLAVLIER